MQAIEHKSVNYLDTCLDPELSSSEHTAQVRHYKAVALVMPNKGSPSNGKKKKKRKRGVNTEKILVTNCICLQDSLL